MFRHFHREYFAGNFSDEWLETFDSVDMVARNLSTYLGCFEFNKFVGVSSENELEAEGETCKSNLPQEPSVAKMNLKNGSSALELLFSTRDVTFSTLKCTFSNLRMDLRCLSLLLNFQAWNSLKKTNCGPGSFSKTFPRTLRICRNSSITKSEWTRIELTQLGMKDIWKQSLFGRVSRT